MELREYHGKVSRCKTCTNPDTPMECRNCLCRGFVASCINCGGTGQVRELVAGASAGHMSSTCSKCGGCGTFPVNKPADWVEEQENASDALAPEGGDDPLTAPTHPTPNDPAEQAVENLATTEKFDHAPNTAPEGTIVTPPAEAPALTGHAAHVAAGEPDPDCEECLAATAPETVAT